MKTIKLSALTGVALLGLVVFGIAYGKGLSVSPASYRWEGAEVGRRVKSPSSIMIRNDSASVTSYTLRAVNLKDLGLELEEGYEALPSTGWVSFSSKRVAISPGKWRQVDVFLEIPEEKEHLGKKWMFFIEVKEYPAGRQLFALSCQSKLYVTTQESFNETKRGRR
jgi:hypothetical protein